jgi:heptosyltransferase II
MKNILLIRLSSLGDIVLTSPAIRAVREHFPQARISMLVAAQSAELVTENPHLDEVIPFDRKVRNKDTGEMVRIVRLLRERNFDLAIDFQRKFRTSLLAYLSGAKCRVGYHQPNGVLCTVRVPDRGNQHAIDRYFDLLHAVDIPATDRTLELFLAKSDRAYAREIFSAKGVDDKSSNQAIKQSSNNRSPTSGSRRFIRNQPSNNQLESGSLREKPTINPKLVDSNRLTVGLFPGAGWKLREWMPDRFAAIGDRVANQFGAQVLIFGGPRERALVENVTHLMKTPPISFVEALPIRRFAALVEACDLFITNDTGPMHIAAATHTPTIALFGPGNHIRFQPLAPIHTTIRHYVPCNPCKQFTDRCKNNVCMKLITVDEVWEAVYRTITD